MHAYGFKYLHYIKLIKRLYIVSISLHNPSHIRIFLLLQLYLCCLQAVYVFLHVHFDLACM